MVGESGDVRLLLDGLDVASLAELKQFVDAGRGVATAEPEPAPAPEDDDGVWRVGLCIGMDGCAYAQRGADKSTWRHFGSPEQALAELREEGATVDCAEVEADG